MTLVTGKIEKGAARGGVLGYPTANIHAPGLDGGIYAARARIGEKEYIAAVFVDSTRGLLEAHLLDFSGDLYGKEMSVELFKKLRESKKFEDESSLKQAIAADIEAVREFFKAV